MNTADRDSDRSVVIDEAFWRARAHEAQERIRAGMGRPGDGIMAFANIVEDGKEWVSR